MFFADSRQRGRGEGLRRLRAGQRGPAQALCERRAAQPLADPGAFCAALLGSVAYRLPAGVDEAIWRVALHHVAQRRPAEDQFRRQLEQRARPGADGARDAGARVALFLLREWERYGLAQLVGRAAAGDRRQWRAAPWRRAVAERVSPAVQLALRRRGAVGRRAVAEQQQAPTHWTKPETS